MNPTAVSRLPTEKRLIAMSPAGSSIRASRNAKLTVCAATNTMLPSTASHEPTRPARLAPTAPLRANARTVTTNRACDSPQVSEVTVASDPEYGKFRRLCGTVEISPYTAALIPPSSCTPA